MFPKKSKILVVDDSDSIRDMVCNILSELGFHSVDQAEDGAQALNFMKRMMEIDTPYDLVISDINMPNMTGLELLEQVKDSLLLKDTPFILATTENEKNTILKALMDGANSYIVKPVDKNTLQERMGQVFSTSKKKK